MAEERPNLKEFPRSSVVDGIYFDCFFPENILMKIKNGEFAFREEDIIVSGYPKSGTTWTNEMVWLAATECDFEGAKESTDSRIPILEMQMPKQTSNLDLLENRVSPRVIATHLPAQFLIDHLKDSKSKVIHVVRNPKDMLASTYHFYSLLYSKQFDLRLEEFFELFKEKKLHFGDWFDHTLGWLKHKDLDNVLILKYEDAKKDHKGTAEKIAKFLGRDLSDEQIQSIVDHTSLSSMRKNPATNKEKVVKMIKKDDKDGAFIRKGKVGDWKNLFSKEQNEIIDERFHKEMKDCGLDIEFE